MFSVLLSSVIIYRSGMIISYTSDHVPLIIQLSVIIHVPSTQSANRYLTIIGPISFRYRLDIVNDIGPLIVLPIG